MVFTLVVSCLLLIVVAAFACVVVVLMRAVRRSRIPGAHLQVPTVTVAAGPGWYDEGGGLKRYWDGNRWSEIIPTAPPETDVSTDA